MARYAQEGASKVKKAMQERGQGTLKSGRSGKKVDQPQTGYRDWARASPEGGRQGPAPETLIDPKLGESDGQHRCRRAGSLCEGPSDDHS